jgi:hypothetical protein
MKDNGELVYTATQMHEAINVSLDLTRKLKVAVKALKEIKVRTYTDDACEVELRARAKCVYMDADNALKEIGE